MTVPKNLKPKRPMLAPKLILCLLLALSLAGISGCFSKRTRDRSEAYAQAIEEQKTKTDNLRNAIRYLKQLTPTNRKQAAKEVQLELNTWMLTVDRSRAEYSPSNLLREFSKEVPPETLNLVGCANPLQLEFSYWDTDYLYGCRTAKLVSDWVCAFPVRDNLIEPLLEKYALHLSPDDKLKLFNAYKLFDWSIRNVALTQAGASVEERTTDPRGPVQDDGMGYAYLPWENLLFSYGDFIERGRVFGALADQQGIDTVWISVGAKDGQPGALWSLGVVIADEILLFEPKLGMPILDPDKVELATLKQAQENERILRRLDLAGQFDYSYTKADIQECEFLIDAAPTAASARMKMLEQVLLGDERMVLYKDLDGLAKRLGEMLPNHRVGVWHVPLLAQVQAAAVRERLDNPSPFSMAYMAQNGVWLIENPAAIGRRKHLAGEFENTLDANGALRTYMDASIADDLIAKLPYDPDVQHQLGVNRIPGEPKEQFDAKIAQTQYLLSISKIDSQYLLAQLHFDRGNFKSSEFFWKEKVLSDEAAQKWWPTGHYTLARIYQETNQVDKAAAELQFEGSPQEAGNRLRLRYLKRDSE